MQLGIGFLLALAIAFAAYAAQSLSVSGAVAAVVLGTIVYGFGGWKAAAVLLTFFFTSSLLDQLLRRLSRQPSGVYSKGGRRDAGQVLGNGLAGGILAVLLTVNPESLLPWIAFGGAIGAVNADTWATELGSLAREHPRLITRLGQHVQPGTSGAVSMEGTAAAALGSMLIGALAAAFSARGGAGVMVAVSLGGFAGALFDSFLGATLQAIYVCAAENVETEQHPLHACGSPTVHVRGWRWLNNDLVNLACSVTGALLACLIALAGGIL